MSDPTRWKEGAEDAPKELAALLGQAGSTPAMPAEMKLAIAKSLPQAGVPVAAAAKVASGASVTAWVLGGCAVALVIGATGWSMRKRPPLPQPVAIPEVSANVRKNEEDSLRVSSLAASASVSVPTGMGEALVPRDPGSARSMDAREPEAALIERARALLVSDPQGALLAVQKHARQYPTGDLTPEREYIRITAETKLGRNVQAAEHAGRFLSRYGQSPYAPAVRRILEKHP